MCHYGSDIKQRGGNEEADEETVGSVFVVFKVVVGHLSSKKGGLSNWDQPIVSIQVYDCENGFFKHWAAALLSEFYWFIPCKFKMSTCQWNDSIIRNMGLRYVIYV